MSTASKLRSWLKDIRCKRAEFAQSAKLTDRENSAQSARIASENPDPATATYTANERRLLEAAKVKPGDLPLLETVKAVFPEAVVIDAQPSCQNLGKGVKQVPPTARLEAARLIRRARQANDHELAVAMRDTWRERQDICVVDGGLCLEEAQGVALGELQRFKPQNT